MSGAHRRPRRSLLRALTPRHLCTYCPYPHHCWTRAGLERHWGTHNGVRGAVAR